MGEKLKEYWEHLRTDPIFSNYIAGLLAAITIAIIVGIRNKWFKKIIEWWKPSVSMADFNLKDIKKKQKLFIPNNIIINDKVIAQNSIDYFINEVFNDPSQQFYIIIGPTGIGKTTFLSNLYLAYRKKSKFRNLPLLFLGKMHVAATSMFIENAKKKGEESKTILLLDALDEFNSSASSSEEYTREIIQKIRDLGEFKDYKKIIISVRQQFDELQLVSKLIVYNRNLIRVELLPFSEEQIWKYVNNRYESEDIDTRNGINNLVNILLFKKHHFVSIPLILDYLKEISEYYRKSAASNLINYDIFKIIEEKWFEREAAEKNWSDTYKKKVIDFCRVLAFKMYKNPLNLERLNVNEVKFYEEDFFNDYTRALSDRSMLIKEYINAGKVVEEYLKFIHRCFLEYFLIEYEENRKSSEESVCFTGYSFASSTYIGMLWKKYKGVATRLNDQEFEDQESQLEAWVDFFELMLPNQSLRKEFQENWTNILNSEDPTWRYSFSSLEKLRIRTSSIWDSENKKIQGRVLEAIKYLKHFITVVDFGREWGVEAELTEDHLACFDGANSLITLKITQKIPNAEVLRFFSNSPKTLEVLILDGIPLHQNGLQYFKETSKIKVLQLTEAGITGEELKYLEGTVKDIKHLNLERNNLSDIYLEIFKGCSSIEILYLGQNNLDGSGLQYFSKCTRLLEELSIFSNKITDEHLDYFKDAGNLKILHLNNNKLVGPGLANFHRSLNQLMEMTVWSMEIDSQYLEVFEKENVERKFLLKEPLETYTQTITFSDFDRLGVRKLRFNKKEEDKFPM